jgi:glycosyltransferase involved in cell wall biosynthesis
VHVIHNGVTAPTAGDPAAGRRRAGSDRYVVAIGTIEPRKNFAGLVRAFDAVAGRDHDLHLVVAGGRGWGDTGIDEAIARSTHPDRIALLGRVDEQARADLLAGATALAYPSVYEGFGLPPLEAMAVGVPVLTTAVGAIPEVVGDAALVVSLDDDALAGGLERLTSDDTLRTTLIERGRDRAKRYSWDRTAAELTALYRRLT